MNYRAKIMILSSWSLLGFKRGINSYEYSYKKDSQVMKVKQHLYLEKGIWGLGSMMVYLNPVTFFFALYKEIYRLEVKLRGLENEKNTDYYNKIL